MKKKNIRTAINILYITALIIAAIVRHQNGDKAGGIVLICAGGLVYLLRILASRAKNRKLQKQGLVLFDERDIEISGKAALFTIRVQLLITGLLVLGLFAFNTTADIPTLILSLHMALSALLLQISYRVIGKRSE
ncbi:MAG: DUF2178 domain-containing protein [Spirochaetales bacterium]|nr:DUF2178 domain-containing protein [Spirochaetales bacterium]